MEISRTFSRDTPVASRASGRITRALLACGVAGGPFFYVLAIGQILTRPGFDIRRHAISLLSLGDLGWIQNINFAVTGALSIACAVGVRRALGGGRGATWGPALIGIFGAGTLLAGFFHADPGLGFPPGAPAGMPTGMSWHAALHEMSFITAMVAMIAASFVFSRRFASLGRRGWAAYCAASGIVCPVLVVAGMSTPSWVGLIIACAAGVMFGLLTVLAGRLLCEVQ
jgi:Protein of unknown function (DUF998)